MNSISKKNILLWSRRLLLSGVIVLGILIAAARLLLPGIVDYRADIETLAVEILDSPVTIEHIESGWAGLRPVITLKGVQMQHGDSVLRLDSLDVVVGIIPSLLAGEIRPRGVFIHMQQFELHRTANGQLSFNLGDLAETEKSSFSKQQLEWLLQQPDLHVDIDTFVFSDQTGKLPAVNLHKVGIGFVNKTDSLFARLKSGSSPIADEINLTASLDKNNLSLETYRAELYLQIKAASLSFWQQTFARTFELPDSGIGDVSVWMQVDSGKIRQVNGQLSLDDLSYIKTGQADAFSIESLAGEFSWQVATSGWRLDVAQLHIQRSGKRWPESAFSVEYNNEGENRFLINADYFRVQDFLPLIDRQTVVHALIGEDLQILSPAGEINDLRLQFSIDRQQQLASYALQTKIGNFSVNAHDKWPGAKGLDGYLVATEQAGSLQLSTTDALLDLRAIFRDPLRLDNLQGNIHWTQLTSGLLIESLQLDASNSHISTQSRLSIHLPEEGEAFVDMQTNFKDGDGAYTSFYIPAYVLGEETLSWLDKGIVAGYVDYGSFILYGSMDDFPFDRNDGRFEVRFKVRDGILDYYNDWPRIDEIEAEVAFVGRSLRIEASSGKIFGADINHTEVSIADLASDNPILAINGKAKTPAKDLFRYLKETGLAGEYQAALSALTLHGSNDLKLALDIPLSKGNPVVNGQLKFNDNQLNIDSWGLQLEKINGLLNFTEQSFAASNLKALYDQQQVLVNVNTNKHPDGPVTSIHARSRANLSKIIEPRNETLAGQFSGESPFEVLIEIPDSKPSQLTISSSLVGTELKFPYPLGKQTDDELKFSLQTGFAGKAAEKIAMVLGEKLQASFVIDADKHMLTSSYVQLGKGNNAARSADHDGLLIAGRLDYLDIDAWKNWYDDLELSKGNTDFSLSFSTDLIVDRVGYARWFIDNFTVKALFRDKVLRAEIVGEGGEGLITYNDAGKQPELKMDMQHLVVFKRPERPSTGQSSDDKIAEALKPSDLPGANINIKQLSYDKRELGQLTVMTQSEESRYQLKKFNLQTETTLLSMDGEWTYETDPANSQDQQSTHLVIDIDSSNFGQFMERLGYYNTVKGGKASFQGDIFADTSPLDLDISQVSGEVNLSILKGEVVEIDPGKAGRVFGLLSFQALPRRLSLDFSDLFSKGMSFDEINGTFTISQGQAYTNNLMMNAPSSQVQVSGRVGLKDEDYNQHVRVIPNLDSALPIAGALAGGPGLAVVVFLTHQLLRDPIDKLAEFEYKVTGPWKSPDIVKISSKKEDITSEKEETTSNNQQSADSTNGDDSL